MCACLVVIHTAHVLVPVLGTQYCYHHCYLQLQFFHFYCIHHFQHLCDLLPLHSHHHLRPKSVLLVKIVHSHHHLRLKSVLVIKIELMVHSHRHLHLKSVLLVMMVSMMPVVFPRSKYAVWCAHCTGTVNILLH